MLRCVLILAILLTGCASFKSQKKIETPADYNFFYSYYDLMSSAFITEGFFFLTSYTNLVRNKVKTVECEVYDNYRAKSTDTLTRRWRRTTRMELNREYMPTAILSIYPAPVYNHGRRKYYQNIFDKNGTLIKRKWYNADDSTYDYSVDYSYNSQGQITDVHYSAPFEVTLYFCYDESGNIIHMEIDEGGRVYYYEIDSQGNIYEEKTARKTLFGLITKSAILVQRKEFENGVLKSMINGEHEDGIFSHMSLQEKTVFKYTYSSDSLTVSTQAGTSHPDSAEVTWLKGSFKVEYNSNTLPAKAIPVGDENYFRETIFKYEYYEEEISR